MTHAALDYNENGGGQEAEVSRRPALGEMLTDRDFLTDAQLEEALAEGADKGERLGEVVVRRGWVTEDDLAKLLAEQWQLGYVDRTSIWFDGQALGRITRDDAQRLEGLPTSVQDGRVVVAVAEPTEQRLTALNAIMGDDAVFVVVPRSALEAGLRSDLLTNNRSIIETTQTKEDAVYAEPTSWVAEEESDQPLAEVEANLEPDLEPNLAATIAAVEAASVDASALLANAGELAGRLVEMKDDLMAASAQLTASMSAHAEDQAQIAQLEKQLAQRTEVGESLKSQLASLSETLESFG